MTYQGIYRPIILRILKIYPRITYGELHKAVCRFANALKAFGVSKGDRVCLYLPMIPELAIAVFGAGQHSTAPARGS